MLLMINWMGLKCLDSSYVVHCLLTTVTLFDIFQYNIPTGTCQDGQACESRESQFLLLHKWLERRKSSPVSAFSITINYLRTIRFLKLHFHNNWNGIIIQTHIVAFNYNIANTLKLYIYIYDQAWENQPWERKLHWVIFSIISSLQNVISQFCELQ